ncbi:methylenetetrahydrofolate reductase 2 [Xylaria bambusicola]|uniref:methylenetetrahydrofolate reductase 2 n=1 Tax=Xylaria bambusicola TaxID=326684 RepID=UPI00200787D5|nr:methylenetetrahydrofolate reductase 2 [Xylaria bambusicola]KAI0525687.1 methylenetetrahydrofolate reductase 2 [Xylaria bambusicola]
MDKITDKIAALPADANYFSLEFFPPKTALGFSNLRDRLDRMARALRPLFVNVTWGAGGSTATKSLELAEICQRELNLTTCLHLTCTNMSRKMIDGALEDAKALGVRNILALRGDPPRAAEYRDANENPENAIDEGFVWAIDLVKYIKNKYGDYFCVGVAAYPEGHADESHPLGQSLEHDLPYLVEKTLAGADFLMTQLFFDTAAYEKFERTLREHPSAAFKTIPIIPGLMPIQSYQMIKRTTKLSHANVPDDIMARLDAVKKDDEKVKSVGVDILCEIIERVKQIQGSIPGPRGFHFYTLNLEKAVSFIIERAHLISSTPEDATVDDSPLPHIPGLAINGSSSWELHPPGTCQSRRQSTVGSEARNRVIVSERTPSNPEYETSQADIGIRGPINTRSNTLAISEGEGVLGREATWDDYPNGRWGDARSPAYGEIDGYGPTLHVTRAQAISLWGYPRSLEDVSTLFVRHLKGELTAIPWGEEEVHEETETITEQLIRLNQRGLWTVASQPAVNGVRSEDPTFGWGPRYGFVFQKAFVEFFVSAAAWKRLREKLMTPEISGKVTYYAANAAGDFVSSDFSSGVDVVMSNTNNSSYDTGESSTNAVTWGVFPGKEILTPTIIEEVSFRAWAEEAFGIFSEWAQVYGKGHDSERLLETARADCWLVNIIHHDYMDKEALWNFLLA